MPTWTWAIPGIAIVLLVVALVAGAGIVVTLLCVAALVGAVVASVHHAEVIAHRVGEPFGTLVLAVAVTVIEASLILSMVIVGGSEQAHLPRDTIYAALMLSAHNFRLRENRHNSILPALRPETGGMCLAC